MRLHQIAIKGEGALVGGDGVRRLAGALAGDAKIIPCLRIRGQQRRGGFKLLHRPGIIAALQQFFALEQRPRPGRRASGDENSERSEK